MPSADLTPQGDMHVPRMFSIAMDHGHPLRENRRDPRCTQTINIPSEALQVGAFAELGER